LSNAFVADVLDFFVVEAALAGLVSKYALDDVSVPRV
jgi:hypothetical protein